MITIYQAKNGIKVEGIVGNSDETVNDTVEEIKNELVNYVKHSDFGDEENQYPTKNFISVHYVDENEYRERVKSLATTTQLG